MTSELDPELRSLIDDARGAELPDQGVQARVHDKLAVRLAAAGAAAGATAATQGLAAASSLKLLGISLLAMGVTFGGLELASRSTAPPTASLPAASSTAVSSMGARSAPVAPAATAIRVAAPSASAAPGAEPPSEATVRVEPRPVATTLASSAAAEPGEPVDALAEELGALRDARARLADGDAAGCLARLDAYEAKGGGSLGQERALLRIMALCRLGRQVEASALADRLRRAAPESPAVARLAGTCAAR
ncbi:MAG: hypothetical protein R3B72_00850 [Polyangiaceae bacterium]